MSYGKLENGVLVLATPQFKVNGTTILNIEKDAELLNEYGFKPIIEAEKPNYPYILSYEETEDEIIEVIERDTAKEAAMEAARVAELQKQFFNTSLGYIKRSVTMQDGKQRDFLTAIVPSLRKAFEEGKTISIYTYTAEGEQLQRQVTAQFFEECENQLYHDFFGQNFVQEADAEPEE